MREKETAETQESAQRLCGEQVRLEVPVVTKLDEKYVICFCADQTAQGISEAEIAEVILFLAILGPHEVNS